MTRPREPERGAQGEEAHEVHRPGRPVTPEPPARLTAIVDTLEHPDISRVGLTTTPQGEWAVMVRVREGVRTPIADIEAYAEGYPVIYMGGPSTPLLVRPARPSKGE